MISLLSVSLSIIFPPSLSPSLPFSLLPSLAPLLPPSIYLSLSLSLSLSEDHPDRGEEGAVEAMQLISMWETVTVHTAHIIFKCKRGIQPFCHSPAYPDTHTLTHSLNLCAMSRHLQVYKTERPSIKILLGIHTSFSSSEIKTLHSHPNNFSSQSFSLLLSLLSITCRYFYVKRCSLAPAQMEMDSRYVKPTTRGYEMTMVLVSFETFEGSRSKQLYSVVNYNAHPHCSTLALSLNWWAYAL